MPCLRVAGSDVGVTRSLRLRYRRRILRPMMEKQEIERLGKEIHSVCEKRCWASAGCGNCALSMQEVFHDILFGSFRGTAISILVCHEGPEPVQVTSTYLCNRWQARLCMDCDNLTQVTHCDETHSAHCSQGRIPEVQNYLPGTASFRSCQKPSIARASVSRERKL